MDKLEEIKGQLYWSISNSCYMLKENLSQRDLASVAVKPQVKLVPVKQKARKVAAVSSLPVKNTEMKTRIDSGKSKTNHSQK